MVTVVAGGAGFIGSHLCESLLQHGHEVICIDNLITGRDRNIEHLISHSRFTFIRHDLIGGVPSLPPVKRVYHLASPASPPEYNRYPVETLRVNSEGTRHLLELAAYNGASLLYCSTSEIYGDPLEHPQVEGYNGNVSTIGPRSVYDEAKRYGESMTMAYVRSREVDARIVRVFNTYGPRLNPSDGRLVANFITQALRGEPITVYGNGAQTRSLCYVSDLVEGLIKTMEAEVARGEVINLGNPDEHTVLEYSAIIIELTGSSSKIVFTEPAVSDDPQRRCPSIDKAKVLLNWKPRVPLRQGLLQTIAYFKGELRDNLESSLTEAYAHIENNINPSE